ncbi:MAG TPA: DUF4142 domain-containing protein, partial [Archangium sp.]
GSSGTSGSIGTGTSSGSVNGTTRSGAPATGSMDYDDSMSPGSDTSAGNSRLDNSGGSVGAGSTGTSGSIGSGSSSSGVSGSVATGGTGGTGSGNSIVIDPSVQKKYDDKYEELSKLSGTKFDREFLATLTDGHKKAIKAYERASKRANDSELKSFATRTLPTLQQHLDRVQSIEKDVKGRRF